MIEILVSAVISALLALSVERVPKFISSIKVRRRHPLLGQWYGYHVSFVESKPKLFRSAWRVQRSILKPFKVTYVVEGELKYEGFLYFEGDDRIVFHGESLNQKEHLIYRFPNPLVPGRTPIPALWLSYDQDKHIAAGAAILSQSELTDTEVRERLKQIRVSRDLPGMRING